jgi:hypothetical protein
MQSLHQTSSGGKTQLGRACRIAPEQAPELPGCVQLPHAKPRPRSDRGACFSNTSSQHRALPKGLPQMCSLLSPGAPTQPAQHKHPSRSRKAPADRKPRRPKPTPTPLIVSHPAHRIPPRSAYPTPLIIAHPAHRSPPRQLEYPPESKAPSGPSAAGPSPGGAGGAAAGWPSAAGCGAKGGWEGAGAGAGTWLSRCSCCSSSSVGCVGLARRGI